MIVKKIPQILFLFSFFFILIPAVISAPLYEGDKIYPKSGSSYYYMNRTSYVDSLEVNDTHAIFNTSSDLYIITNHTLHTGSSIVLSGVDSINHIVINNFTFNLTEGSKAKLYNTSNTLIDNAVPVMIASTEESPPVYAININSSQKYTNINLTVWSNTITDPDSVSKTWYYQAVGEDETELTDSNSDIDYSGGYLKISLYGINVSIASQSNRLFTKSEQIEGSGGAVVIGTTTTILTTTTEKQKTELKYEPLTCTEWIYKQCKDFSKIYERTCTKGDTKYLYTTVDYVDCCDDSDCNNNEKCQEFTCIPTQCTKEFVECKNKKKIYNLKCGQYSEVIEEKVICCEDSDCPSNSCMNNICQYETQKCVPILQYNYFGTCRWFWTKITDWISHIIMVIRK